ncbi:MAG: heme-binding protein [Actinomycetota bacterium]|nr:MAG: SOUL heme-binding [Actinomycetota bacterium]MDO8949422.1 heme-binding protein [Actinomycetota bacterium]MDP3629845.1 heme-binding protein [Actinomycetota bacterium]
MAVETPKYEVLKHEGSYELRRYAGYLTANVLVTAGDYGGAMSAGFNPLADYTFGNNRVADRISMTAPVTAGRACCQKIPMTVPVTAQQSEEQYVVSFTMPGGYSMDDLPQPNNAAVSIEPVAAHLAAVARFGGGFTASKVAQAQTQLESWIVEQGLTAVGEPIVAQYDPPWKPGFARRSEIMIVVEQV